MHDSIPEDEMGEVFGIILSRKCSVSEDQALDKRSFSVRRSASVSESYSRIHHQSDTPEEDEISSLTTNTRKKKKGKFLRVFKRLFGL